MNFYAAKNNVNGNKAVIVDDMLLTTDMPTTAGSKMLSSFTSLFEAEAITRIKKAGYEIAGKARVGEFAIDLLGETAYDYDSDCDILKNSAAEIVKSGDASAAICLDVNGSVRRAAAQNKLCSVKSTYGTVSRYGTIPVACSGEVVSVLAKTPEDCEEILKSIAGHDDKDGTSLSDEQCMSMFASSEKKNKVILFEDMYECVDADVKAMLDSAADKLSENGVEVIRSESGVIGKSNIAWNILMSSELCNNVSRYDGVKYGYRSSEYTNIDELYTNSRTESFGELLKTVILFGSENLSTENYMKYYDKAMRVRRVVSEKFAQIFSQYDAVLMPAASSLVYTKAQSDADKYSVFKENVYTAPSSITGLPSVVCSGVQLMGKAFSEKTLFDLAKLCKGE